MSKVAREKIVELQLAIRNKSLRIVEAEEKVENLVKWYNHQKEQNRVLTEELRQWTDLAREYGDRQQVFYEQVEELLKK